MSGLMSPLRIPRPERAEGTVLAALLAVLLGVMLCAQAVLPQDRPALPDVPAVAARASTPQIAAVSADPVLARRAIFQPTRLAGAGADAAGVLAGPLDGAVPAGIVRVRGAARLVLQTPDGKSVTLRPGQSYRGWRLSRIGTDEVRFMRGAESVTLSLGAIDLYSYPGSAPPSYDPRDYDPQLYGDGGYQPNQADEE
jgi:hypothetical protein